MNKAKLAKLVSHLTDILLALAYLEPAAPSLSASGLEIGVVLTERRAATALDCQINPNDDNRNNVKSV